MSTARTSQATPDDIIHDLKTQIQTLEDELVMMRNEAIERVC